MTTNDGPYYAGVDLGGTQLRMAAVAADGRLVSDLLSAATGREFGPDQFKAGVADLVRQLLGKMGGRTFQALGLGTAGVLREGRLTQVDNLPLLGGADVVSLVRAVAGAPVRVENDARCFALAEARFGAGRGARHLCGVTLGTGVGCGVVIDGKVHRGATWEAGEVWRLPLRDAPLEDFVSGAGVVRGYIAAGGTRGEDDLDAAAVAERAREGDPAAAAAWRSLGEDLAFLGHCIFCLIDPECLVIGGSLAQSRDLFEGVLGERLGDRMDRVAWAELGAAAGVIGAAALNIPSL
jgi:glucokinase